MFFFLNEQGFFFLTTEAKRATLKPWPNDRNMTTQHITTLLGATCCVRLATMLRHVAGLLLAPANLTKSTTPNMSQQGGQTHATFCAQQCCDMLHWHVAIVWPGLKTIQGMLESNYCGSRLYFWSESLWVVRSST